MTTARSAAGDAAVPEVEYLTVHGHDRAFVKMGRGPALLLLHGLACDHRTWRDVLPALAEHYTVIAPDLLGHGQSAKPRADYTLGGYANAMRDLLTLLGIDKVTVVGHSFGGGVAMQFAYQFPERTERMVLVSPGGLGREVSLAIKLIQAPGWEGVMRLLTQPGLRHLEGAALRALAPVAPAYTRDLAEAADILDSWRDRRTRFAIRHLVRAVIDWRGQVVTMSDRAYLTEAMPVAVIWGEDDRVLPVRQAEELSRIAPGARVEIVPDAGHFVHRDHPEQFVRFLHDFITETAPAKYSRGKWRRLLSNGPDEPLTTPALRVAAGTA
ncbi:alpha/beta fold hydrolase [Nocardioides panacisoli]|uniref:alpha/beta fold hydrolase n=1 Tax=Nocardioides panacisoli TaxID=627624 RepID=UPI001C62E820|nr:alpha/beta fold hydrolase [Nocardioides panacisoli]QYJ05490.1 alpha/beta fold hydrolase [Nocardioides panacisoli]